MLIRPRYRRPLAITNLPSVTLTTAMPRSGSVRVLSGLVSLSREGSAESGVTTQRTPAGTEPTGEPLAASLTNSSPPSGPPMEAIAAPTESPMRSSGSALGVGAPPGRLGHPAEASSATLSAACFGQRRIQLPDREIDVRVGMRARDESSFERGRCEEHATCQRGLVPAREQRGVRLLRIGVVAYWTGSEVETPHRARVPGGRRNPVAPGGILQPGHQPVRATVQLLVEPGLACLSQGREPRRHRDGIAREGARLVDRPFGCNAAHQVRSAAVRADRESATHDLAQRREIGSDTQSLLSAARGDAESGHHLIKDQ